MREVFDRQRYIKWTGGSSGSKVVGEFQEKYNRIGEILDGNPEVLELAARDLRKLSRPRNKGRKATYTCENLLRAVLVHQIEGRSLRDTEVLLAHTPFLQDFLLLGTRPVPSYATIDRALKALQPETLQAINRVTLEAAVKAERVDSSKLRLDSTVVEATIHYPTDSSLLWDSFRVLYRLINEIRELEPGALPERFHAAKVRKHHLYITRYLRSNCRKRRRTVRKHQRR